MRELQSMLNKLTTHTAPETEASLRYRREAILERINQITATRAELKKQLTRIDRVLR
jgi:hypothetical protein